MPRITKAQREADQLALQRLADAFDNGREYFWAHPEDDMATIHRYASGLYSVKAEALEFTEGYSTSRRQKDEFLKEKGSQS